MEMSPSPIQFLALEEVQAIDQAMLSPMAKFMTRITVSSLRIVARIATDLGIHAEELESIQIVQWVERDSHICKDQGLASAFLQWDSPYPDIDFADTRQDLVTSAQLSSHEKFLTRMVISAMQVLRAIAMDCCVHIEDLTVDQIIIWTERDAKTSKPQAM